MDDALKTMINNMPEKTGKALEDWLSILNEKALEKHGEMVSFLKSEYGITHGFANTIVHLYRKQGTEGDAEEDLLKKQYEGKEHLLPILHELRTVVSGFGDDIEFAPKKAYLSLRTGKQFALIQPSTKKRVGLGLVYKDTEAEGILEESGSFSAMCTHRIRLQEPGDIDKRVQQWLQKAYEMSH